MAELEPKPIDKILHSWATITIDRWQEELVKMNIGAVDGNLMRSFTSEVQKSGGDAWHVLMKFLKHGRFVDMGVGRGHPLGSMSLVKIGGNQYKNEAHSREPKKWYGKIKTREIAILRFIIAKNFSILALKTLETQLKTIK